MPLYATATNIDNSGDQHTEFQPLASDADLAVHVIPSGEVITRFVPPPFATATKIDNSGDQHTENQPLASAADLAVHVLTHASADA